MDTTILYYIILWLYFISDGLNGNDHPRVRDHYTTGAAKVSQKLSARTGRKTDIIIYYVETIRYEIKLR